MGEPLVQMALILHNTYITSIGSNAADEAFFVRCIIFYYKKERHFPMKRQLLRTKYSDIGYKNCILYQKVAKHVIFMRVY